MPDASSFIAQGLRYERAGVLDDAFRSYEAALEVASTAAERAEALRRQSDVRRIQCEWDGATDLARRSEEAAQAAGSDELVAEALNAQAAVQHTRGRFDEAVPLYERVLTLTAAPRVRGAALQNLGAIHAMQGHHEDAARRFEESLACFRRAGYDRGVAIALNNVGRSALERQDLPRAEESFRQALALARRIDDLDLAALAGMNLAESLLLRGQLQTAEQEASGALGFFKVSGNQWRQIDCLRLLGDIRAGLGDSDTALRMYDQGLSLAERIGAPAEAEVLRSRIAERRAATGYIDR